MPCPRGSTGGYEHLRPRPSLFAFCGQAADSDDSGLEERFAEFATAGPARPEAAVLSTKTALVAEAGPPELEDAPAMSLSVAAAALAAMVAAC